MRILRSVPQGTPEFMSTQLWTAIERGETYVQSPVDDLQSFWWATLWAAVYNPRSSTDENIQDWRGQLGSDDRTKVRDAVTRSSTLEDMEVGLVKAILPLLWKWDGSLDELWVDLKHAVAARVGGADEAERKRLLFYRFAYRGVTEFVTLLANERESIQAISG